MMFSTPAAAAVAAIAALCFFAGWNAQGWRMQSRLEKWQSAQAAQEAAQQAQMRAMEQYWNEQLQSAITEAQAREQALRADAAAAGTAAARLRTQLQHLRGELAGRDAENPPAAALARADTAAELLATCADRYSTLAAQADRHAADALTCRAAWPAAPQAAAVGAH